MGQGPALGGKDRGLDPNSGPRGSSSRFLLFDGTPIPVVVGDSVHGLLQLLLEELVGVGEAALRLPEGIRTARKVKKEESEQAAGQFSYIFVKERPSLFFIC